MNELFMGLAWNKKLEILRTIKGWSQIEAAEQCQTNQKAYWNWEKGKVCPRRDSQKVIAAAFGVDIKEIFGNEYKSA
ncbi:helix-turn-helix domain protein [Oxobacter pfennigii]|uniref:Helix-turn-helix domain protein n=1 Tax=Oxobacter pfennigii TaxID=36849 RepID=A0A0P8YRJ0_9CLOT|nr:helix-turn-helix transcriptional regulator [Oxobacter pfennigii]KPU42195.1 helix-turn-helix domain protein [Oxobacter pfennigii]